MFVALAAPRSTVVDAAARDAQPSLPILSACSCLLPSLPATTCVNFPSSRCLYWDARRAASREPPPAGAAIGGLASGALTGSQQQPGSARRPAPAEDEADSAAVKRKRSAEEEAAAQKLKGISADSRKRLLEVAALPLAGTPLDVSVCCGWESVRVEVGGIGGSALPAGCEPGRCWPPAAGLSASLQRMPPSLVPPRPPPNAGGGVTACRGAHL